MKTGPIMMKKERNEFNITTLLIIDGKMYNLLENKIKITAKT